MKREKKEDKKEKLKKKRKRKTKKVSKAMKGDLLHYRSKWKMEQWPILALPDGQITEKFDMLILRTWWTAIWHSKKVTLWVSSPWDC